MVPQFDIFQMESDGGVLWIDSAETLEQAQACIKQLGHSGKQYILLNHRTGHKLVVTPDGDTGGFTKRENTES